MDIQWQFLEVIKSGDILQFALLLEKIENVNYILDDCSPLIIALNRGNTDMVELLLDKGANPNAFTAKHISMLSLAVFHAEPECVELLLKAGASIGMHVTEKQHAIHTAARYNRHGALEVLLRYGVDPNLRNEHQRVALIVALLHVNEEIIKILLPITDLHLRDSNGNSVLYYAKNKPDAIRDMVKPYLNKYYSTIYIA